MTLLPFQDKQNERHENIHWLLVIHPRVKYPLTFRTKPANINIYINNYEYCMLQGVQPALSSINFL